MIIRSFYEYRVAFSCCILYIAYIFQFGTKFRSLKDILIMKTGSHETERAANGSWQCKRAEIKVN